MEKQKLKRLTKLLLLCFVLGLVGCEQEDSPPNSQVENQNKEIITAKKWFEDYKTKVAFDPMFNKVDYHWEVAAKVKLEDGTEAIRLPITDIDQAPEYKGEKMLYLYPSNQGYDAVVHELIPDERRIKKEEVFANLESYNGYVITWDLKDGFIKGAKFIDSKIVATIKVRTADDNQGNSHNSLTRREPAAIDLDEVVVYGGGGQTFYISSFGLNSLLGGGSGFGSGGGGGTTGSYFSTPHGASDADIAEANANPNPCDKIKKLKDDPNYKNAVAELKKNFKLQYESGYYISKSNGYESGTHNGSLLLTGTTYPDTYGIMHVHEDDFTHQVNNNGVLRNEDVTPIRMFSPGDVNTFCSLLITANKYKTTSLDEVFTEMVSSSGRYQLRFEGDINNVKNFDYNSQILKEGYMSYMDKYSNDLETGLLMFIKDYIGISGITLFKMNDNGSTESKTLSSPNVLATNPC